MKCLESVGCLEAESRLEQFGLAVVLEHGAAALDQEMRHAQGEKSFSSVAEKPQILLWQKSRFKL
jgi:hypothetical protein